MSASIFFYFKTHFFQEKKIRRQTLICDSRLKPESQQIIPVDVYQLCVKAVGSHAHDFSCNTSSRVRAARPPRPSLLLSGISHINRRVTDALNPSNSCYKSPQLCRLDACRIYRRLRVKSLSRSAFVFKPERNYYHECIYFSQ